MPPAKDVLSLTDFKRGGSELLRRIKRSRQPVVLTVKGKPELVVQSAEDYHKLIDEVERMQAIEGIRRGLESMKAGKGREANEVFDDLERKYPFLRER